MKKATKNSIKKAKKKKSQVSELMIGDHMDAVITYAVYPPNNPKSLAARKMRPPENSNKQLFVVTAHTHDDKNWLKFTNYLTKESLNIARFSQLLGIDFDFGGTRLDNIYFEFMAKGTGVLSFSNAIYFLEVRNQGLTFRKLFGSQEKMNICSVCVDMSSNFLTVLYFRENEAEVDNTESLVLRVKLVNQYMKTIQDTSLMLLETNDEVLGLRKSSLRENEFFLVLNQNRFYKLLVKSNGVRVSQCCNLTFSASVFEADLEMEEIEEFCSVPDLFVVRNGFRRRAGIFKLNFETGLVQKILMDIEENKSGRFFIFERLCWNLDTFIAYSYAKATIYWLIFKKKQFDEFLKRSDESEGNKAQNNEISLFDFFQVVCEAKTVLKRHESMKFLGNDLLFLSEYWGLFTYSMKIKKSKKKKIKEKQ